MRHLLLLIIFGFLSSGVCLALVSEGRPGIPYFNHVLFLQQKVVENKDVIAVSLAYSDPGEDDRWKCSNSIDVFGGLELFSDIPDRTWVLVDYELQSILIDNGFTGDADVFKVSACKDLETCLSLSQELNSDPQVQKLYETRPRAKSTVKANFETIQEQLELGRKLVKAARCRGCHNLEGFGPDHAPSLTWKRFKYEEYWLENYLEAPYRMRPAMGDLMMLKYTSPNAKPSLKVEELNIVAKYLTNVATASAPSERYLRELWQGYDCYECHTRLYKEEPIKFTPTPIPQTIRDSFQANETLRSCTSCHPFGDINTVEPQDPLKSNAFATDLVFAFEKLSINYIGAFLQNPSYLEPQSRMPNLGLSEDQIEDILNFSRRFKEAIENGDITLVLNLYEMKKKQQ